MPRDWPQPGEKPLTPAARRRFRVEAIVVALILLLATASAFAKKPPVPPKGSRFRCTPVAVWDGDGPIWCAEGPRLRLAGINARELDGSCRRGARCPAASGIVARDTLVHLLGEARGGAPTKHVRVKGPAITCRSHGPEKYRRTLATCMNVQGDIGSQLFRAGTVAKSGGKRGQKAGGSVRNS